MRRLTMKREGRRPPIEHVEMISTDPEVFDTGTSDPEPGNGLTAQRTRPNRIALAGVALIVVAAIAVAWPRSSGTPQGSEPSSAIATSTSGASATTVPGRDAPVPWEGAAFALTVEPSPVVLGTPVVAQLQGDLSGVSSPISAVAWVDEQVSGVWRTIEWMARSPGTAQAEGDVSNDLAGPSPDAVTFAADQPVWFDVDALPSGTYRLCRYVPLRANDTSSLPSSNPAYVCAPLIVGRVRVPVAIEDEGR